MQLPLYENKDTPQNMMFEMILSPRRYPWFYEHFINIQMSGECDYLVRFNDAEDEVSFRHFCSSHICIALEEIINRIQVIGEIDNSLEKFKYIYIWLDKFYVPETDEYECQHYFHPVLVYGKDEKCGDYYIVDFTGRKGVFKHNISRESIEIAFWTVVINPQRFQYYANKAPIIEEFRIDNMTEKHDFSLMRFTSELENYVLSRRNIYYDEHGREQFQTVYGISTYEKLLLFFGDSSGRTLPFKCFYDLGFHKKFLYDRVKFIAQNYEVSFEFEYYIGQIRRVADIFEKIKNLNLKEQLRKGYAPNVLCLEENFLKKAEELLREAESVEKTILPLVLRELSQKPLDKFWPVLGFSNNGITRAQWKFDQNRTFKFVTEGDIINIDFAEGIKLSIMGNELRFVHRHVDIDAEKAKNIAVELRNASTAPDVYFDFTTYENVDFSDNMSIKLDVPMSTDFSKIDIDMSGQDFWSGRILDIRIRLKSDCKSEGNLTIKGISIF